MRHGMRLPGRDDGRGGKETGRASGDRDEFHGLVAGFEQHQGWFSERPATRFARVQEQPLLFVAMDSRFVRVRVDGDIERLLRGEDLPFGMGEEESRAVGGLVGHGRVGEQFADQTDAAQNADFVSFVIAEASDEGAGERAERPDGDRRHEIAREQDALARFPVEPFDGQPDMGDMVVGVRENADAHTSDLRSRRGQKNMGR